MATSASERCFLVEGDDAGLRLDRFLATRVSGLSRRGARAMLEAGCVLLAHGNGPSRTCRIKATRLQVGDRVTVRALEEFADPERQPPVAAEVPGVRVLHSEPGFLVMHKPAGIPSHPLRPGETQTLANAVVARCPECVSAGGVVREAGLCHRLDVLTSGLVLVARTRETFLTIRSAFRAHAVDKRYWALVHGAPPESFTVQRPIRSRRGRRRVQVGSHGLEAVSEVRRLAQGDALALVEVQTRFGRRHQVRAHLAHAGYPLVGDTLYRGESLPCWPNPPLLHAGWVRFPHPVRGALVEYADPIEARTRDALDAVLPSGWADRVD